MLLRSGRLPTSGDYAFEPKWDGFRALVSRNGDLRVKSRRGWDMTSLVPELAGLPDGLAVDGELVAFGDDGLPSFPRLCDRMLHGKRRIEVMLVVFDVLAIDGREVTRRPYWERRQLLEDLALDGDHLVDDAQPPGRRGAVGEDLRTRPRGRRRQETQRPLPPRPTRLDQDQEPRLLALPARGSGGAEPALRTRSGNRCGCRLSTARGRLHALRLRGIGAYSGQDRVTPTGIEDGMAWNRLTIVTVVLGVATLFFAVSGATGTWWPVVICGILFLIGSVMVFRERTANSRT